MRSRLPVVLAVVIMVLAGVGLWVGMRRSTPLDRASTLYRQSNWKAAAAEAREALRSDASNLEARRLLARSLARQQLYDRSQAMFARFEEPDLQAEDCFLLGSGLLKVGNKDAARGLFELAIKRDPQAAEAILALAPIYLAEDRLHAAATIAERLVDEPAWNAQALAHLSQARQLEDDTAQTIATLEKLLAVDPDGKRSGVAPVDLRKRLARAHLRRHEPDRARAQLDAIPRDRLDAEIAWLNSRVAIQQGDRAAAETALSTAEGLGPIDPAAFEPAPYTGAASCTECHKDIHRFQQNSRHAKTFHTGDSLREFTYPTQPITDPGNPQVVHRFRQVEGRTQVETSVGDQTLRTWIVHAMGSGDRGMTPLCRDDQGVYRELRFSFYGGLDAWDRTIGHAMQPREPAGYQGDLKDTDNVRRCLGCHVTDYLSTRDHTGPASTDRSIGCERCHGPGGNHLAAVKMELRDLAISRLTKVTPARSMQVCTECHNPRGRLFDPEHPASVRFQGITLSSSRCFIESAGNLGCVSCHNPHRDAETDVSFYEKRCQACHAARPELVPEKLEPPVVLPDTARKVSCPVNPQDRCIECHMRSMPTPVPHFEFTDHFIRVHRTPIPPNPFENPIQGVAPVGAAGAPAPASTAPPSS